MVTLESHPPRHLLRVVSGMPRGSGCSQFNGYEIRPPESDRIDVTVTHHQVSDTDVVCTADYPIIETIVPLGADFEPGVEYAVGVNSGDVQSLWSSKSSNRVPAAQPRELEAARSRRATVGRALSVGR